MDGSLACKVWRQNSGDYKYPASPSSSLASLYIISPGLEDLTVLTALPQWIPFTKVARNIQVALALIYYLWEGGRGGGAPLGLQKRRMW
jgi:hypothetical protein